MKAATIHLSLLTLALAGCSAPAPKPATEGAAGELYLGKVPESARMPVGIPTHGNELRGQSTVGGPGATQGGYMSTGAGGSP